tara:strand:+ start:10338 stop:12674 length:2337 start_codon:yes stop_codon:yes gene_type:complete
MPIRIVSRSFQDLYGNTLDFYQSNSGDMQLIEYTILEQILVIGSMSNYLSYNALENEITWSSGSWLVEGFRVGDSVLYRNYDDTGTPILAPIGATIVSITGANNNIIQLDSLDPTYIPDITTGEYFAIWNALTGARTEEMVISINQTQTGSTGNEYSPIDGEATRFLVDIKNAVNYPFFPSGQIIPATQFGKKSGQYACVMELETTNITPLSVGGTIAVGEVSILRIRMINPGMLTPSLFDQNKCLKIFSILEFARLLGEPYNRFQLITSETANTGYFDEAYNVGVVDASIGQGISSLAFDFQTSGQIIVKSLTSPVSRVGVGMSYIPTDEDYYRNKAESQSALGMTIYTQPHFAFFAGLTSPENPDQAKYIFDITAIQFVGNDVIIDYIFTPNAEFNTFMLERDQGDRLFQVWIKVNNVNLLIFNDQLVSNPPVAGALTLVNSQFFGHSYNVTDTFVTELGYTANIEDDLGFVGKFTIDNDTEIQSFTARIEAYNTVTEEEFILLQTFYSFVGIPLQSGIYPLNESNPIISTLPLTSEKRISYLIRDTTLDTLTEYGVRIYFPFLLRWEYWLSQLNANDDFYPNQNRNWYPYDSTGSWIVRLHLELVKDNLAYVYDDNLEILNYDNNDNIDSEIELIRDSTGQIVDIAIENELMRVRGTHVLTDGTNWSQATTWGMLTVEPFESGPRWICSSVIPFDNNISNPLTPLTALLCSLTFPSPDTAVLECYFDSTKINLSNDVKFTSKIKQRCTPFGIEAKLTTGNEDKITTNNINKDKSL